MGAKITDIAYYLPTHRLSNEDLARDFPDTSAEKIYKQCGIRNRYIAPLDLPPSALAIAAAEQLFAETRNNPLREDIDAILYCSEGLDYKAPATACIIHSSLRLKPQCLALDIPGGCTGFMNGLMVAQSLIGQSNISNVLLLTSEIPSRVIDKNDLHLRMLFGDGACATLIQYSEQDKLGTFQFGTDGNRASSLWVDRSGMHHPVDAQWLQDNQHNPNNLSDGKMIMKGEDILHFALSCVPPLIDNTLLANRLTRNDIDLFIFHQASTIILKSLKRKCRIPDDKFLFHLEACGNIVSSTIPLALHHAVQSERVKKGSKVLLAGFGIGLSWSATVIEIT